MHREFHATKKGPGRRHRDGTNRGGSDKTRYVTGLQRHWAKKRRAALPKVGVLRDEHGSYTLIGRQVQGDAADHSDYKPRRKWLAGISAQRGY